MAIRESPRPRILEEFENLSWSQKRTYRRKLGCLLRFYLADTGKRGKKKLLERYQKR